MAASSPGPWEMETLDGTLRLAAVTLGGCRLSTGAFLVAFWRVAVAAMVVMRKRSLMVASWGSLILCPVDLADWQGLTQNGWMNQ